MTGIVGRQSEQLNLMQRFSAAAQGKGNLVLLAGEGGAGKTRLVMDSLAQSGLQALIGPTPETAHPAYASVTTVMRSFLREHPSGLAELGPLAPHLALLLPELGQRPAETDQATLIEAIFASLETIARSQPTAIVLDDLQWADHATLDFLSTVAARLKTIPLMIVGIYRSEEIARSHPMRRMRAELRRQRLLHEIKLLPLKLPETTLLASQILNAELSPGLASILFNRTQGLPFFIEELAIALEELGQLQKGAEGLALVPDTDLPVPQTIRDTVLLRLDRLSAGARDFLEVAAAAGMEVDLDLVSRIASNDTGFEEAHAHGFLKETTHGRAVFRHALTREAIYQEMIWSRRRALHLLVAEGLKSQGAPPQQVAEHRLLGQDYELAREALVEATQQAYDLHAYRDAAATAEKTLEIWPKNRLETERLEMLDLLGQCAQLSGQLSDAARAWRELAKGYQETGIQVRFAETQRRLAGIYQLIGAWSQALTARQAAAAAFLTCNLAVEAASEYIAIAAHLQGSGNTAAALETIETALQTAEASAHPGVIARTLGLKGVVLGKAGKTEQGLITARSGLSLALQHNLTSAAAEIYWRYAATLEQASNYKQAQTAYLTAIEFCHTHGESRLEQLCLACAAGVFWQTGEWQRAITLCREVLASTSATESVRTVARGYLGTIHVYQGETRRGQKLLKEAAAQSRRDEVIALEFICIWGLAMVAEIENAPDDAQRHCRHLLEHWRKTEERHYVVPALRWAATFFNSRKLASDVQACARALADIAAATGNPEALAALSHALGEDALLNAEPHLAQQHFNRALELLEQIDSPIQVCETQYRAGIAHVEAGEREQGIQLLIQAHRNARRLSARPLADRIVQSLDLMGEKLHERLGKRSAGIAMRGGLTRRQLEVLQWIARGKSNQEIAQILVLSVRTVDMHVSNILTRLDCRTRAEAVHLITQLGLLD